MRPPPYPLWLRLAWTAFVAALVPVYWRHYGPANLLWFSDLALLAILMSLWSGWRLPYSMMAVGTLPFEILWIADFMTGARLLAIAGYMFDPVWPLWLRAFSLFHLVLPVVIVWMLWRDGYDRRALTAQTAFAVAVLALSWLVSTPEDNVNWVFGLYGPQTMVDPRLYLVALVAFLPLAVYLPMHLLLKRLFDPRPPVPD